MSKNKNKAPKEEVKAEAKSEVVHVEEAQDLAPKLSTYLNYGVKKLAEIEPGHREIDIAAKDAIASLEKAVDLVKFIESIQGK